MSEVPPPRIPTTAPPTTPAPAAPAPAATPSAQQNASNVKETIESILVAFILAFIFRAFVVEAFVIPTGSMAPTLLGAHMHFRCPDCGYVFDVNYSSPDEDSDDPSYPAESRSAQDIYCPNCGYKVANGPERDRSGRAINRIVTNTNGRQVPDPVYPYGTPLEPIRYGDRILVLKYAYLFGEPRRWDVIVFKSPYAPERYHYEQNYIKRLVGLPGDRLMVLDGDLYKQNPAGNWEVEQKPPDAQNALWRIVYDNDFLPQNLPRGEGFPSFAQPWKPLSGSGWTISSTAAPAANPQNDRRTFRFKGDGPATIAYDANANPGKQNTTDYLVYDVSPGSPAPGTGESFDDNFTVSDLKLALLYNRDAQSAGKGPLQLTLSKRDHAFTARIDSDSVSLIHTLPDGSAKTIAGPTKLADLGIATGAGIWVEFSNVDYKVTLRLNNQDVFTTDSTQYAPDVDQLLREYHNQPSEASRAAPRIEITAADQTCSISHIGLWRDIYYTNRSHQSSLVWAMPDHPVTLHHRGDPRENAPGTYDDDEYFVMGDNSANSLDARYWTDPIDLPNEGLNVDPGRVPSRFILGRAFFVYWPSGFRPSPSWPSIVPDFGDMRFIH